MRFWKCLGVSAAILVAFGFFALKALQSNNFLQERQKQMAIALAGAGALLWLVQKVHHKPVEVESEEAHNYASPFYATGSYWGIILLLCGAMVGGAGQIRQTVGRANWKGRFASLSNMVTLPRQAKANARGPKANTEPEIRLQGIGYNPNPAKSSVIINGQTLLCGESAGGIKVLSINAGSVTVEAAGQVKVLTLK
jgi:hypothetical protein